MKNMRYAPERFSLQAWLFGNDRLSSLQRMGRLDFDQILNYGLLPAAALISISLLLPLLVQPLDMLFGLPGILVLTLSLLSIGLLALNRCVYSSLNPTTRAWSGLMAGAFIWFAIQTASRLGEIHTSPVLGFLLVILAILVISTLWRPVFPLGVKFAVLVFVCNWIGRYLIVIQAGLAPEFDLFRFTLSICGFTALVGLIFCLLWMVLGAELKIQRMWSAVGVWFSALMLLMIFGGILI